MPQSQPYIIVPDPEILIRHQICSPEVIKNLVELLSEPHPKLQPLMTHAHAPLDKDLTRMPMMQIAWLLEPDKVFLRMAFTAYLSIPDCQAEWPYQFHLAASLQAPSGATSPPDAPYGAECKCLSDAWKQSWCPAGFTGRQCSQHSTWWPST